MIPTTEEQTLLDTVLNLGTVPKWLLSGLKLKDTLLSIDQLDEFVGRLSEKGWLYIESGTADRILIPEDKQDEVKELVETLLGKRGVSPATLIQEIENDYISVVKTLAFLRTDFDGRPEIGFSDYSSDRHALQLCEKLATKGYLFYISSSSRKHSYQTFYPRRIPFDVKEVLQQFVVGKLNLEGLDLYSDWRILIILVYSENTPDVTLDDLRLCLPNYTKDEIAEVVGRLEARCIVARQLDRFRIPAGVKDLVESYFLLNKYQEFKASLIRELRMRVSERPSSLYMLGVIKKILLEAGLSESRKPFITINRYDARDIAEQDLLESSKLGILFLTSSTVTIACEALSELEELLRSAIREETFASIPAKEEYTAVILWRTIFEQCRDYLKIQDEWVNEVTLAIIESYAPADIPLTILCSSEGSRDVDVEEMRQRVERLRKTKQLEFRAVGYETNLKAPFHERYIISGDVCFMISQSIKDVGKSKSATIVSIPRDRKESLLEPAFNYWAFSSKDRLKSKGVARIDFKEWLSHYEKTP